MDRTININGDGKVESLQVSRISDLQAGDVEIGLTCLLKNITDENLTVQVRPAGQTDFVTTVLYPGWNVELVNAVKGVTANTLQYGW